MNIVQTSELTPGDVVAVVDQHLTVKTLRKRTINGTLYVYATFTRDDGRSVTFKSRPSFGWQKINP